jgi:histidinol-phosphate aminotransferase
VNSGPRFRDALQEIPGYRAGERPDPRTDGVEAFKVSSNENPYPPLPQVVKVIEQAAHHVNRYPDPGSAELIEAIAAHAGVPREHVAVATGAVALCYQFAQSTAGPGDEVVFAWRSFEAYPIVTSVAGAQPVAVPLLVDGRHDMAAIASAVTDRTRLVFICSPNNPTGTVVTQDELDEFMAAVPNDVMVVLDEAYIEFCRDPSAAAGLVTYTKHQNLAVLRTFSKAYGLAGLRVGYAIAQPPVIEALNKTALPFGVSVIAQAAAAASLADDAELRARVDALVAERTRVMQGLRAAGVEVVPSEANFVWLPLGEQTEEFANRSEQAGLTVRAFAGEGVRVTIAETAANDRFIGLASDFSS